MGSQANASAEAISLPKGGGALQGLGEKFSPDLQSGTGNFSVPITLPPGRNGLQPQLSLTYSTGAGNGPFGLGWSLSVPAITRKTSAGIPRYRDAAAAPREHDTFVLSGAEDLVPVTGGGAHVQRYRPRTEGLFARIERHLDTGIWEVCTKDGLVSVYGAHQDTGVGAARIADPNAPGRVFAWKLSETRDPFGNRIRYEYLRDAGSDAFHHWDELLLHRILYADYEEGGHTRFLVSVELEYGERPDPCSDRRAGFEIRTRKRCRKIVVRTHTEQARLVRDYRLVYLDERVASGERPASLLPANGVSLLSQVIVTGHDGERIESLPPLELGYTRFQPERRGFFPITGRDLPARSFADRTLELVDLFGGGLPDILEMGDTVRYWRNRGDGSFDLPRPMPVAPAGLRLDAPGVQIVDANGDGRADLLVTRGEMAGYFPLRFGTSWDERGLHAYKVAPTFSLDDPEVRLVDLDGDGVTDALRAGTHLECFFNDPEEGWRETRAVERCSIPDFPNISFSDSRVRLADMSGDGLNDIVLIHDGSVEYWPALGWGSFGRRVLMCNSPRLPAGYDPGRLLLGDVDRDGCADLVYVEDGAVHIWINRCGNSWSDPVIIRGTPPVLGGDHFRLADLLGHGIPGLLWSSNAVAGRPHLHFLDLIGGVKPYLLHEIDSNTGAVTLIDYAPSTRFYAADAAHPATRWKTTLPFPVHVVARTVAIDALSGGKLTTEYTYRHGYWDGAEREFRGFARVDQRDTEAFGASCGASLHPPRPFAAVDARSYAPPLETRTWFHPGPVGEEYGDWEEPDFSSEYWHEPGTDCHAPGMLPRSAETDALVVSLPRRAARDAVRTLRGRMLRTELYARDGSSRADRPYTVTEYRHAVREEATPEQPCSLRRRLFFPHEIASRTTEWERGAEPMTRFAFTGDYDALGQPRASLSMAVPRGRDPRSEAAWSEPYLATLTLTAYASPAPGGPLLGNRVAHVTTYELPGVSSGSVRALRDAVFSGAATPARQVIAQVLSFYDGDAFKGLPLGHVGSTGARVRTEQLVLTPALLAEAYGSELPLPLGGSAEGVAPAAWQAMLPAGAGYVHRSSSDGAPYVAGLYVTSERHEYDFHRAGEPARGLVRRSRDPLGSETRITYDGFGLLPVEVQDAAGLLTRAEYDYRILQPREVKDPNGNRRRFTFTPPGLLESVWVMGKEGEAVGDTPALPSVHYVYDFNAFAERREPVHVRTLRRVWHALDATAPASGRDDVLEMVEYSDGFGRLLQTRALAEDTLFGDPLFGGAVLPFDQEDRAGTRAPVAGVTRRPDGPPNVVVSGWQRYDNKGRVVEKWEPFFSTGWAYRSPEAERDALGREVLGRKAVLFYDARGRVERTLNPDGSEQRAVQGTPADLAHPESFTPTPWEVFVYDANDNAGRTPSADPKAATYRHHHDTPSTTRVDALGRMVESVQRNRARPERPTDPLSPIEEVRTRTAYDIRGNVLAVTDALGRQAFRHVYDLANRPLRVESIDAGTRTSVLDAAGSLLEARDAKGGRRFCAYDALHRPVRLWARDVGTEPVTLRERLVYGDAPEAGPGASAANRLGRLFRHYDEAGLLVFESYDFKGSIAEKVRRVVRHERVFAVVQPAGKPGWLVQAWRMEWTPPKKLTLEEYVEDLLDVQEYRSSPRYDALGRVVSLRLPRDVEGKRREVRARFNRGGTLESVTLEGRVHVEHIAYNAKGQRTLIAYGNGVMTRHAYAPETFRLARLRSERFQRVEGAGVLTFRPVDADRPLQDMAYACDLSGNILEIRDRTPGGGLAPTPDRLDRAFAYDALYRLLEATGRECAVSATALPWDSAPRCQDSTATRPYAESYMYDAAGNLLSLGHRVEVGSRVRTMGLVPGTNRLTRMSAGGISHAYTHDANGNMVREDEARWFEWDHADRMRVFRNQTSSRTPQGEERWAEPTVHAHYLYDAANQRVAKMVRWQSGRCEVTLYLEGQFEHHIQIPSGARPKPKQENNTLHLMDGVQRIAIVRVGKAFDDESAPEHAVKYHLGDHLGSSHVVVSGDGAWINREEYTPYGETSFGSFARKRYRYTGKERDEESGLSYHGARYYAPWLGRWTSCDPAGPVDGLDLYEYGRNNPLLFNDPTGLSSDLSGTPPLAEETVTQTQPVADPVAGFRDEAIKPPAQAQQISPGAKDTHSDKVPFNPSEQIKPQRREQLKDLARTLMDEHATDGFLDFHDFGSILDKIKDDARLNEMDKAHTWNQVVYSKQWYSISNNGLRPENFDSYRPSDSHGHIIISFEDSYHGDLAMLSYEEAILGILSHEESEGGTRGGLLRNVLPHVPLTGYPDINVGDIQASMNQVEALRAYCQGGFKAYAEAWQQLYLEDASAPTAQGFVEGAQLELRHFIDSAFGRAFR